MDSYDPLWYVKQLNKAACSQRNANVLDESYLYKPPRIPSFDQISKPTTADSFLAQSGLAPIPSYNKLAVADYGRERVSCFSSYSVDDQPIGLLGVGSYRQLRKRTEVSYECVVIERLRVTTTYYWD